MNSQDKKRDVQNQQAETGKKNKPRYFNSAQAMQTCIVSASRSLEKCDIHPAQEDITPMSKNKTNPKKQEVVEEITA